MDQTTGAGHSEFNANGGISTLLESEYGFALSGGDLYEYVVGLLAQPRFTQTFWDDLEFAGVKVPLTRDGVLFQRCANLGRMVIAYQTYAERFPESINTTTGLVPPGRARIVKEISSDPDEFPATFDDVKYDDARGELSLGTGLIANVHSSVWEYEVSGLQVVRSWIGYRLGKRAGKSSSTLDNLRPERWTWQHTKELLELLWVLEGLIALEPEQGKVFQEIVAGELFLASELPEPTMAETSAPSDEPQQQLSLGLNL